MFAALPACPYPSEATARLASQRQLPSEVAAALAPMAEAGAPFEVGDAIVPGPPLPNRRFSHAEGRGCTLTVDYEQGGRGYSRPTARFVFEDGRWRRAGWP